MDFCPSLWAASIAPATDAPQPKSPAESLAAVNVPDGFSMSLVASEPLIQDPSGITFDEWGRLFVCELHGYNIEGHLDVQTLNETGELDRQVRRIRWEFMGGDIAEAAEKLQYGVVKLLSDEDGDGVMDQATVWADQLPPCYGLVPARGGIIAVCAPDIVFLADHDLDGKVDTQEILFTGFNVRTLERGINNPRWGVDNWIYVGGGGEGGTITGPNLPEPVELGGTDFRIKADGSAIEPVTGRVGTFGLSLNAVGDRFPSSGGTPVIHTLPIPYQDLQRNPHVPSPRMNYQASPYNRGFRISKPHPWRVRRQQDPAWVKFYGARETDSNYFSGGCSGEFYVGGAFPNQFHESLFYCEPSLNIIHRSIVERRENEYVARRAATEQRSEFLASTDQWFRPMSLRFGPDGALYIVDMYREIIEDYSAIPRFLQQQYGLNKGSDRGRIWRLAPEGLPGRTLALSEEQPGRLTSEELARRLAHRERWWRQTAGRLLVEREAESAVQAVREWVREDLNLAASLGGLYVLEGLKALEIRDVRIALQSRFPEVRIHGLRLAKHFSQNRGVQALASEMTTDSNSRVRLQLALTLGEMDADEAVSAMVELATVHGDDRWMDVAILSSALGKARPLLLGLLRQENPGAGAARLFQSLTATMVAESDEAGLQVLMKAMPHQAADRQVALLSGVLDGLSKAELSRLRKRVEWEQFSDLVRSRHFKVAELAVEVAVSFFGAEDARLAELLNEAKEIALRAGAPEANRLHALELIGNAQDEQMKWVAAALLVPSEGPSIQEAALNLLGKVSSPEPFEILVAAWPQLSPERREGGLNLLFSREDRLPILAAALESERILAQDLSARQRERLRTTRDESLRAAVARVLAPEADASITEEELVRFEDALSETRDLARGEEVFRTACATCHQVKQIGVDVGPSLASITGKPDPALLLDVLDPNAKVDPEFRSYLVRTKEGESYSGLMAVDGATSVTLRAAQGVEQVVLRQDIEALEGSNLSLMPANFSEILSPRDVSDLLGFLRASFTAQ